jgi:hypothetical protein
MAKNNLSQEEQIALKAAKNRLAVLTDIAKLEEKIAKDYERTGDYNLELNNQLTKQQKQLSKIDKLLDKGKTALKEQVDLYSEVESSLGNLSSLQDGLKKSLQSSAQYGIEFSKSLGNIKTGNLAGFKEINKLLSESALQTSELAQLNKEDAVAVASKNAEIAGINEKLSATITALASRRILLNKTEKEILDNAIAQYAVMQNSFVEASKFANISEDTKGIYEELMTDLEGIEKTFKKLAITTQIFFSSFKNAAGVALFFVGGLVDDFNELSKGIGGTVTQMFQLKAQSFAVSKILGDEAGAAVTSLAQKLGNANDVTLGTSIAVGTIANRLGVSGDEAATLVNQFGNLSGLSNSTAMNTMEAASQLASANGVAPANVMKDIAENTEFFALYSKDGGANIAQAAIEARRLGVDLSTAAKISDNLLDYQTSVASEMEASVLLGRNINLNKARELAYAGDSAGAMKEALNAAGGLAEFNKMDVFQKKAVAEALGTTVSELQQMSANMEKAATPAGKLQESFNATTAFVQEMGAGIAGTAVKGIGGMLIGMKDFKGQISDAKEGFTFLKDSAKGIGSLITGGKGTALKGLLDNKETSAIKNLGKGGAITPATPMRGRPPKVKSMLDSVGNPSQMLAAAVAMIAFAGAILILSFAFQNFSNVSWEGFAMGIAAMGAMVLAMKILIPVLASVSASSVALVPAIGIMLAFGGAIALIGFGINLAASGMATLVKSFSSLETNQLIAATVGVVGLSVAFYGLASSLTAVAAASTLALPGLAALAIGGLVGGVVGGLVGGGENDGLGDKIDALTTAIMAQPIILTLDGNVIAKTVRKETSKSNIPK